MSSHLREGSALALWLPLGMFDMRLAINQQSSPAAAVCSIALAAMSDALAAADTAGPPAVDAVRHVRELRGSSPAPGCMPLPLHVPAQAPVILSALASEGQPDRMESLLLVRAHCAIAQLNICCMRLMWQMLCIQYSLVLPSSRAGTGHHWPSPALTFQLLSAAWLPEM
jgi:hypothetical protein